MMGAQASRRKMLGWLGMAPVAGRAAAEQAARTLTGIGTMSGYYPKADLSDALGLAQKNGAGIAAANSSMGPFLDHETRLKLRNAALRAALRNPTLRGEVESLVYEDHRYVGVIAPDLAVLRSVSFMAKVTYQRQRNVARELEHSLLEDGPYQRMHRWGQRILKGAGINF